MRTGISGGFFAGWERGAQTGGRDGGIGAGIRAGGVQRIGGDEMIGDDGLQELEPEKRELRQHSSLLRYAGCKHVVEGREAIGRYKEQMFAANLVKVANFSTGVEIEPGKVGPQQNVGSLS